MSGTVNEAVRGMILPFSFKYFHNYIQQDFSGQGQGWINHTRICNLFLGGLIVLCLMSNPPPAMMDYSPEAKIGQSVNIGQSMKFSS